MTDQDPWAFTYEDDTAAPPTDERLAYELLCGIDVRLPNEQLGKQYFAPGSEWDQKDALRLLGCCAKARRSRSLSARRWRRCSTRQAQPF
jgi:hypothetical protein